MFGSLAKMANVVRLFVLIFPTAPSIFVQRKYLLRIPSVRINWLAQSFSSFSLKIFLHLPATFHPTFDISCIWSISFIPENTCGLFPFFPFYCSMFQFRCRERDGWRGTSPSPRCPMPDAHQTYFSRRCSSLVYSSWWVLHFFTSNPIWIFLN